ncbi:MAG: hypothetical protein WBO55_14505 [Rhizobiaceae bacterium]
MRGISLVFFATGVACVCIGMCWGIWMGISDDHTFAPAHAHLNLVGWVTMALFGVYYHLVPAAASTQLSRIHYALALIGVVMMVPGIVMVLDGRTQMFAKAGSLFTLASMLVFAYTVWRNKADPVAV